MKFDLSRWSKASPFISGGNQVSFKWKSSWNLFIPKFTAHIPEEMLPSRRLGEIGKGYQFQKSLSSGTARIFPHPHFFFFFFNICCGFQILAWDNTQMWIWKWKFFPVSVLDPDLCACNMGEGQTPQPCRPWIVHRASDGPMRQVACSPVPPPQAGISLRCGASVPRQCGS